VAKREQDTEFERFYEEHREAVRAYCLRRADASLADDIVSQTFEIAWRRRSEVRRPTRGWLLGIARKVLANRRRSDRRQRDLAARLSQQPAPAGESFDDSPPILDALSRLSDPDRETLMLAAWEGLGSFEAGRVLGCSPVAFRLRHSSVHAAGSPASSASSNDVRQRSSMPTGHFSGWARRGHDARATCVLSSAVG
jgi:RNA polymerase sigma-70 factor, ECF subfamily